MRGANEARHARLLIDPLRGRRVMVTFAFAHCEAVCHAVVHDLQRARRDANAADAALVIVTPDPWRDAPSRLHSIADQWQLSADDRVLSGSVPEVLRVHEAWHVAYARDTRTGEVSHTPAVALLDRAGRVTYRMTGDWQQATALLQTL